MKEPRGGQSMDFSSALPGVPVLCAVLCLRCLQATEPQLILL